jgi:hypothetical protein
LRKDPGVEFHLSLAEAESLHALLEDVLEDGEQDQDLQRAYRLLSWRILAARGGTGLIGRVATLAREAGTLDEYEEARDRELGPVLKGLESAENRDP